MLSYQHAYHAANLADVHKHAVLAWVLDYLCMKPKPLSYIETHAGRGLYNLAAPEAAKTGEAAQALAKTADWFDASHPYAQQLAITRAAHGASAYPGSPLIAAQMLRPGDRMHLAELHPQEHAALTYTLSPYDAHIHQRDGAALALSVTPPDPRRGLCLIDPSYEVKDDYDSMPVLISRLHRKWAVGGIILWYPLLEGGAYRPMLRLLGEMFPDALRHEVRFPPARDGHRMQGSGLFILNPPYGLATQTAALSALYARIAPQD